jgi:deoxyribonuclease-4
MNLGIHLNSINFESLLDALILTKKLDANILQIYLGDKRLTTLREKYKFTQNEIKTIKLFLKKNNIKLVIHAILTLNFCNDPTSPRYKWGIDNLVYDMIESNKLGAFGCVIHMGSYKTQKINISSDECMKNFIKSLIIVLERTQKIKIILETPVYKKYKIGNNLENFALLYNSIPEIYKRRIKTCIDTQHIFASGYDISTKDGIKNYLTNFTNLIGIKNLALIHLNDSLKEFNSGVDRHAPIGEGFIFKKSDSDSDSLSYIINFCNLNKIPIVLETKFENFKNEIKYLKGLIYKSGGVKKNYKKLILKIFNSLLNFHETLGKSGNISTRYRIDSYKKGIKTIEQYNKPIYSSDNLKNLPHIGKGFIEKINEIINTGTLSLYENIKKNNKQKSILNISYTSIICFFLKGGQKETLKNKLFHIYHTQWSVCFLWTPFIFTDLHGIFSPFFLILLSNLTNHNTQ